jgi:hypothetical protein
MTRRTGRENRPQPGSNCCPMNNETQKPASFLFQGLFQAYSPDSLAGWRQSIVDEGPFEIPA